MKERIARAIYHEFENRPIYAQLQMCGPLAEELADTALAVMREPTPRMLEDAGRMTGYADDWPAARYPDDDHIEWWHAMIDAAISEGKE
jgi:hypothetical protein